MKTIKHIRGKHNATFISKLRMYWCSLFTKSITLMFTNESKYTLAGNDQEDFNKILGRGSLLGYDFNRRIRKNEEMLVWRYIPSIDKFEVAKYWRTNYKMKYEVVASLNPNEAHTFDLNHFRSVLPTSCYFGGNRTPNKDLKYYYG